MGVNAFQPKATVLIKIAQLFSLWQDNAVPLDVKVLVLDSLLDDIEVVEWLDRMAYLEYIPKREITKSIPPLSL